MDDDLNSILIECAKLRGCYPLLHRTLHEFNWFINAVIWGGKIYYGDDEDVRQKMNNIRAQYNRVYASTTEDNELIDLAKAFLEYCKVEYNE